MLTDSWKEQPTLAFAEKQEYLFLDSILGYLLIIEDVLLVCKLKINGLLETSKS